MSVLEESVRLSCEELLTKNESLFTSFFDDCPVTNQSLPQPVFVSEPPQPSIVSQPHTSPQPQIASKPPQAEEEDEDEFFLIVCSIKQLTSCRSTSTSQPP